MGETHLLLEGCGFFAERLDIRVVYVDALVLV